MDQSRWAQVEESATNYIVRVLDGRKDIHPQEIAIIPALIEALKK